MVTSASSLCPLPYRSRPEYRALALGRAVWAAPHAMMVGPFLEFLCPLGAFLCFKG